MWGDPGRFLNDAGCNICTLEKIVLWSSHQTNNGLCPMWSVNYKQVCVECILVFITSIRKLVWYFLTNESFSGSLMTRYHIIKIITVAGTHQFGRVEFVYSARSCSSVFCLIALSFSITACIIWWAFLNEIRVWVVSRYALILSSYGRFPPPFRCWTGTCRLRSEVHISLYLFRGDFWESVDKFFE